MGGKILTFSADRYFDAGKAEGINEGMAKGKAEGINEGMAKGIEKGMAKGIEKGKTEGERIMAKLVSALIADGKTNELARMANDKAYRDSLYQKYAIM